MFVFVTYQSNIAKPHRLLVGFMRELIYISSHGIKNNKQFCINQVSLSSDVNKTTAELDEYNNRTADDKGIC